MNEAARPRLYLHIGLPKTGTTTIQHFLRLNADLLKSHGILYPSSGRSYEAHHELAMGLEGTERAWVRKLDLDEILAKLRFEVQEFCASKIIVSSEILTFLRNADIIKEKLQKDYDLTVIIFLRRQDDWIESCYRQDLAVGEYASGINDYLGQRISLMNFDLLLKFWEELVGIKNVQIVVLGGRGYDGSAQRNFLAKCEIPWIEGLVMNDNANMSLSRDCIDFLMLAPDTHRASRYYQIIFLLLAEYTRKYPDLPAYRRILSPAQRADLIESYRESNCAIAERYYPGENRARLFDELTFSDQSEWAEYPGLTPEKAAHIGHFLCQRLAK